MRSDLRARCAIFPARGEPGNAKAGAYSTQSATKTLVSPGREPLRFGAKTSVAEAEVGLGVLPAERQLADVPEVPLLGHIASFDRVRYCLQSRESSLR